MFRVIQDCSHRFRYEDAALPPPLSLLISVWLASQFRNTVTDVTVKQTARLMMSNMSSLGTFQQEETADCVRTGHRLIFAKMQMEQLFGGEYGTAKTLRL